MAHPRHDKHLVDVCERETSPTEERQRGPCGAAATTYQMPHQRAPPSVAQAKLRPTTGFCQPLRSSALARTQYEGKGWVSAQLGGTLLQGSLFPIAVIAFPRTGSPSAKPEQHPHLDAGRKQLQYEADRRRSGSSAGICRARQRI